MEIKVKDRTGVEYLIQNDGCHYRAYKENGEGQDISEVCDPFIQVENLFDKLNIDRGTYLPEVEKLQKGGPENLKFNVVETAPETVKVVPAPVSETADVAPSQEEPAKTETAFDPSVKTTENSSESLK